MNNLSLKLATLVVVIFGLLITGIVLWKPIKVRYYASKLQSPDIKVRQHAAKILLDMTEKELVFEYYTEQYKSDKVEERMAVVDELCACGDKGKAVMKEIFRSWCFSQQVMIPAGSFMMGSEKSAEDERPVHKVKISSFKMDKYEVTNEKYYIFVKLTDRKAPKPWQNGKITEGRELHPVSMISWEDAKAYVDWLGLRLPTEAEWEYACRAGSSSKYCFGDNDAELYDYAWYGLRPENTHPVGEKKPNKWGLYDMHGGTWEWCSDWYCKDYYAVSPAENPKGPEVGQFRVVRGGCWFFDDFCCRSSGRSWGNPVGFNYSDGFRTCSSSGR